MSNMEFNVSVPSDQIINLITSSDEFDTRVVSVFEDAIGSDIDTWVNRIADDIDMDDLASKVANEIDMDDLATKVINEIEISDHIDYDELAQDVLDEINLDSEITSTIDSLLCNYYPENACRTGQHATTAIGRGMLYLLDNDDVVRELFKAYILDVVKTDAVNTASDNVTLTEINPFKYTDASNNQTVTLSADALRQIVDKAIDDTRSYCLGSIALYPYACDFIKLQDVESFKDSYFKKLSDNYEFKINKEG